jgi:hypothetical protein
MSNSDVLPTPPGAAGRRRAWPWILGGGCALGCVLLIVLVIAGIGLGAHSLFDRLQRGDLSCLPKSFPVYPGSTFGGENFNMNAPTPGNVCEMVYETSDSAATVVHFYRSRLSTGAWDVTATDAPPGEVDFRSSTSARTHGSVTAVLRGDHVEITIRLYSPS